MSLYGGTRPTTFPRISVEGNIGSGKTTLLKYIEKNSEASVNLEPVEEWKDDLVNLYKEPQKFAHYFEMKALLHCSEAGEKPGFQERSIFSSYYVFAALHRGLGNISKEEFEQVHKYFRNIFVRRSKLNAIIYLRQPARVCLERIKERERPGENHITLEFLRQLKAYHNNVFYELKEMFEIPIISINGRLPVKKQFELVMDFTSKLKKDKRGRLKQYLPLLISHVIPDNKEDVDAKLKNGYWEERGKPQTSEEWSDLHQHDENVMYKAYGEHEEWDQDEVLHYYKQDQKHYTLDSESDEKKKPKSKGKVHCY